MTPKPLPMRDALLARVRDEMVRNEKVWFVTADFGSPVLDDIRAKFGERFVNVGVAEQTLINVSAGLALEGNVVFAYAIAPFITMRCFEQIRVNLCLLSKVREMNVNLIGVGAGYSYVVSGPTHQCYEDISIMRTLPVVRVLSPSDHHQAASLLDVCVAEPGIRYIRLDAQVLPSLSEPPEPHPACGYKVRRAGHGDVVLLATGYMVHTAEKLADALASTGISVGLVDMIDLSRPDGQSLVADVLTAARLVVTLEEGFGGCGGLDSLIATMISRAGIRARHLGIGVPPDYSFELGTRTELHHDVGISSDRCLSRIQLELTRLGGGQP